jgi:hypothetical protein
MVRALLPVAPPPKMTILYSIAVERGCVQLDADGGFTLLWRFVLCVGQACENS